MKGKKIIAIIGSTVLAAVLGVTGVTVFAASDNTAEPSNTKATTSVCETQKPVLTDAQKAKMEANRAAKEAEIKAAQDKWSTLTDAQKEEIYALKDKQADIQSQIIDKYLEFGVIDETTANKMKTNLADGKTKMRENDKMPMMGFGKGGKARLWEKKSAESATSSQ